jgi:sporulation protein YlmC with PRC-barrel domain
MFTKTTAAAALLGAALMTTTAFAQTTAPADTSKTPSASASTQSQTHEGLWRASKLVGVNVYNDNNEKLGDINDLLVDNSGNIKNVIIGVGGFLGVGERYISVSFNQLKFSDEPMRTASSSSTQPPAGAGTPAATPSRTVGSSSTSSSTSSSKNWYPDHAILSGMSKDQVKSMPEFKY